MTLLNAIRFIFELRGALSGYKTYVGLTATMMSLTAAFLANHVIPWMDGAESTLAFAKVAPEYLAAITAAWSAGALRHSIEKNS
jgi:hypothetical protein